VRPAPQGRAYRERRHFHHVTVLLSSDDKPMTKNNGRNAKQPATATRSKRAAAPQREAVKTPATESAAAPSATETKNEQATEE